MKLSTFYRLVLGMSIITTAVTAVPNKLLKEKLHKLQCFLHKAHPTEIEGMIPINFFSYFLPERPIIVQGGAYCGSCTIDMKRAWPNSIIHCFEPVPDLFKQLNQKVSNLPDVYTHNFALAEKFGISKLYVSKGNSSELSSLLEPEDCVWLNPGVLFDKAINVPTISLNQWSRMYGVTHVDMVWLCAQGYEDHILQAADEIIKNTTIICTQVATREMYKGNLLYHRLKEWLESFGFIVLREEISTLKGCGKVCFVREAAVEKLIKELGL